MKSVMLQTSPLEKLSSLCWKKYVLVTRMTASKNTLGIITASLLPPGHTLSQTITKWHTTKSRYNSPILHQG